MSKEYWHGVRAWCVSKVDIGADVIATTRIGACWKVMHETGCRWALGIGMGSRHKMRACSVGMMDTWEHVTKKNGRILALRKVVHEADGWWTSMGCGHGVHAWGAGMGYGHGVWVWWILGK